MNAAEVYLFSLNKHETVCNENKKSHGSQDHGFPKPIIVNGISKSAMFLRSYLLRSNNGVGHFLIHARGNFLSCRRVRRLH